MRRRAAGTLALWAAAACATSRPRPTPKVVVFPPMTIVAGPASDRELAGLNEQELFAKGKAAFAAGSYPEAARCFDRGADSFPDGPLHAPMAYDSGLAHLQLHEWPLALERFRALADPERGQGDALDAAFQEATCLYFLEDYAAAAAVLARLAARADLPEAQRLQAGVDLGVCQVELGQLAPAERELRKALAAYRSAATQERMSLDVAGKAEFFLGEIYRLYFEAVKLDPSKGDLDDLGRQLEGKAEELLSAQGHYLRAIRTGSPHWATGAGFRIGALYEKMYDALLSAPMPPGLTDEETRIYREELRRRVRVLVTKAIHLYDQTLAAADRIGEENPFVNETRESLNRMKSILAVEPPSAIVPPAQPAARGTP